MFWRVEKFRIRKGQMVEGGGELPWWSSSSLRFHCRVLRFDPWSGNQDPARSPKKKKGGPVGTWEGQGRAAWQLTGLCCPLVAN